MAIRNHSKTKYDSPLALYNKRLVTDRFWSTHFYHSLIIRLRNKVLQMQIRISMHPNLTQSLLHQHIWTHFILVLYEQPQRMPHLCYEEPSCYYLRTRACDMKAVVPFPISLAYLQGGSLKQPFDSHVLAVVASPVERSLPILVPSLCHEFRALQQSL